MEATSSSRAKRGDPGEHRAPYVPLDRHAAKARLKDGRLRRPMAARDDGWPRPPSPPAEPRLGSYVPSQLAHPFLQYNIVYFGLLLLIAHWTPNRSVKFP
jgi:hypothetical protein